MHALLCLLHLVYASFLFWRFSVRVSLQPLGSVLGTPQQLRGPRVSSRAACRCPLWPAKALLLPTPAPGGVPRALRFELRTVCPQHSDVSDVCSAGREEAAQASARGLCFLLICSQVWLPLRAGSRPPLFLRGAEFALHPRSLPHLNCVEIGPRPHTQGPFWELGRWCEAATPWQGFPGSAWCRRGAITTSRA